jgi:hypothetical protein
MMTDGLLIGLDPKKGFIQGLKQDPKDWDLIFQNL